MSIERARVALGTGACALSLLYTVWTAGGSAVRATPVDPYGAGWASDRFREVARVVPPGTRLGYLSDIPADVPDRATFFATVRYAVAPALLQPTAAARQVIGDFRRTPDPRGLIEKEGLAVDRDLGNGAFLLRRIAR